MKCVIPNQNVKIIARAIHSLSKIGDELFIEPMLEQILFRTVNMAQSAFAEFKLNQSFFSSYSFSDPSDVDTMCKVTMRSCINVFKNAHSMEKQIENCEIRMKSDATVVILQLKFTNASVKKYYLPIIDSEKLEACVPTDNQNCVTVSSKMLMSTVKNFRYSEEEITITVDRDKTYVKNHIELNKEVQSLRTELCFHPSEFENYTVSNPTCITFCLKELRAVLLFAEPANLSVCLSFSSPGMPVVFRLQNFPVYEASYVVSTLNPNITTVEINSTRPKRVPNQHTPTSNTSQADPYGFIDETTPLHSIHQISASEPLVQDVQIDMDCATRSTRIEFNDELTKNNETRNSRKRKNSREYDSPMLSDGIESVYSSFDSNCLQKKSSNTLIVMQNHSDLSSDVNKGCDDASDVIKLIFARCFTQSNVMKKSSKSEIILAESSDMESV